MNVCLVRGQSVESVNSVSVVGCPPIGLAYLSACLKQAGHTVSAVDGVGEAIDRWERSEVNPEAMVLGLSVPEIVERIDPETEVIGLGCMFSNEWPFAAILVRAIRERFPGVVIVMGGEHITAVPEYCLNDCPEINYLILSEGEVAIVELLDELHRGGDEKSVQQKVSGTVMRIDGQVAFGPPAKRIRDIDTIADPDWSLFRMEDYISRGGHHGVDLGRTMPILASRGCPYQCTFCSSPNMWTTLWKARSPASVIAEMKRYQSEFNTTNFDFYDLTAIVKKQWIVDFATQLVEEMPGITWQLPSGTRSEAIDAEVSGLLFASGCKNMNYAPESGNPLILKRIKKKVDLDRMLESMRHASAHGIGVKSNILMGFPGERKRDLIPTFRFLAQMALTGADDVACFAFCPYPGSELFEELHREGKVELDHSFLESMVCYTDPMKARSHSVYMSDAFLRFITHFGMAFFYAVCFTRRPWKAYRVFRNLFITKTPETKLESALWRRLHKRDALKVLDS